MLEKSWPRKTSIYDCNFVSLINILQSDDHWILSAVKIEAMTWLLCTEISWNPAESKNCVLVSIAIWLNHLTNSIYRLFILVQLSLLLVLEMKGILFVDFSI